MPTSLNTTSLGSIHADGSKKILHPADVSGPFTRWRRVVAAVLLIVYIALPWIPINGYPAIFLDVLNRRFHFFGFTLATQDLWVFFFLVTGLGFSLFYVTSLFGRVWCGWTCPYTVFLEHVFRRVERLIDGDAPARRLLDKAPWNREKIIKRVVKHTAFILIAATITHIFLSYFVSLKGLYEMMHQSPMHHSVAFGVVVALTIILYFCFSWFREQFCVIMCPYGRMQSALSDDNTVIIGYDKNRGEPRGRANDPKAGDCINCNRCVQVCPTGIDIRNGMQLECIGCAACIDACGDIMRKLDRKPGLIRYDSYVGLHGGKTRFIRPRTIFYSILVVIGLSIAYYNFSHIEPMRVNAMRQAGQPYYVADGNIRNQYMVRVINKRNQQSTYTMKLEGEIPPQIVVSGLEKTFNMPPLGEELKPLMLTIPQTAYTKPFIFFVRLDEQGTDHTTKTMPIEFVGPDPRLSNKDYLNANQYLQK